MHLISALMPFILIYALIEPYKDYLIAFLFGLLFVFFGSLIVKLISFIYDKTPLGIKTNLDNLENAKKMELEAKDNMNQFRVGSKMYNSFQKQYFHWMNLRIKAEAKTLINENKKKDEIDLQSYYQRKNKK